VISIVELRDHRAASAQGLEATGAAHDLPRGALDEAVLRRGISNRESATATVERRRDSRTVTASSPCAGRAAPRLADDEIDDVGLVVLDVPDARLDQDCVAVRGGRCCGRLRSRLGRVTVTVRTAPPVSLPHAARPRTPVVRTSRSAILDVTII